MRARKIIRKCSKYLSSLDSSIYHFHYIDHTRYVARKTSQLLRNTSVSQHDFQLGILAAWSHDLGYKYGRTNHEVRSAELISDWMKESSYSQSEIQTVAEAIMSTKIPQKATSEISKALCDADMAHLASPKYLYWADKLEAEWVATQLFPDKKEHLLDIQINFIQEHRYLTDYAIAKWESRKQKTLVHLIEQRSLT